MSTIKDRIIDFIKAENISKRGFASAIGKSNSYVNNIVSTISADAIQKIQSEYPNLNIDWLLTGEGDMVKQSQFDSQVVAEPRVEYVKRDHLNQISTLAIIDRNSRSIEKMVEISDRNSRSIEKIVESNQKLIDLLHKNGIAIPDNISIHEKREQSSESDTDEDTAYNAKSVNVG